jgi:hypothetical protein
MNQMSAMDEPDAMRMAKMLLDDYHLVYVAMNVEDGEWCVFYDLPRSVANVAISGADGENRNRPE